MYGEESKMKQEMDITEAIKQAIMQSAVEAAKVPVFVISEESRR